MSSSIDDRIVAMKFDNSRFERGVATTLSTLDRLKRALSFGKTKDPLADVQASANRFNLATPISAVQGLSTKFVAMSTIAITALSNIVNKAVDAGLRMGKSLTLQPVLDGFAEYELKMGSIQTILSNTSRHGTTLGDVTKNLDELNTYADKTIYNFGDMTKNIGLFTNAGIKIEDATSMIKGFSNEAASSGTNAQGAASAAYQLSQALSAGTIRLMDWRSLQNVGMGNKNMQNGLIEIADAMGELEKAEVSAKQVSDDFNGSLEKKWLSAGVMENYLKIQAGEYSEAQMKNLGLSEKQIASFQKQQKISEEAATKVRTWTQLIGTLKEGIGSSWSESFDIILGDFNEATELFTNISETLGDMFGSAGERRNDMLKEWDKLGGRDAAIEAFANAWKGLLGVVTPIKEAFREIFPAKTGRDLYNITVAIRDFTENFKMGAETTENVKRTFLGFFAVLSIGWQIIKGVAGVIGDLFGAIFKGSGSFLEFTGDLGDFFTDLDKDLKSGKGLTDFFSKISTVLTGAIEGIGNVTSAIGDFFAELELGEKIKDTFANVLEWLGEAFSGIGTAIAEAIGSESFDPIMDLFKVGLLGGIMIMIRKFFKDGSLFSFDMGGGLVDSIKDTFDGLTDSLTALQTNLKAKTLMTIAGAIALLTASVFVLSTIDDKKLKKALTAMAIGFGELLIGMGVLTAMTTTAGFIKLPIIAASMILLAAAILILSAALKIMSTMDWDELKRGLSGLAGAMTILTLAAIVLAKNSGSMLRAGIGMVAMAIALNIMASAVQKFADMDGDEIARGLLTLAGALGIVIIAVRALPDDMLSTSVGLLLVAAAIKMIAAAVVDFGKLKTDEISQGLVGLGLSLAIIVAAMHALPPHMLLSAASLLIVAAALGSISDAVADFGEMDWDELARGLIGLAASLTILVIAMAAMNGSILGSMALMLAAAALAMMVPVLISLGNMSWEEIAKGMTALALSLTILGVASYLIGPMALVIVALGAGMLLLGAGLALAGTGALAFASAFSIVVGLGTAGIVLLTDMASALIKLLPSIGTELAKAFVNFMTELGKNGPAMVTALNNIFISFIDAFIKTIPKIQEATTALIQAMLKVLEDNVDDIARVGLKLLVSFLTAIRNNMFRVTTLGIDIMLAFMSAVEKKMPSIVSKGVSVIVSFVQGLTNNVHKIVHAVTDLIIAFLGAIAKEIPRIADAGAKLMIAAINGMADAVDNNQRELNEAANRLGAAIINGIVWGLRFNSGKVGEAAKSVANSALEGAKNWLGINSPSKVFRDQVGKSIPEGMVLGIHSGENDVSRASSGIAETAIESARKVMSNLNDAIDIELTNPTIRPILDLSDIQKNAGLINNLMPTKSISANVTHANASAIASQLREPSVASSAVTQPVIQQKVEFNQHNTSPKALTDIEIYRQTNNLLSTAKGALNHTYAYSN